MIVVNQVPVERVGRGERPVVDGETYWRASSLAQVLDDTTNLSKWMQRQVLIGVAKSPDLVAQAATTDPGDSRTLNELVRESLSRAKSRKGANFGTAIHSATELMDRGADISDLPESVQFDAAAYRDALAAAQMEPLMGEVFVACPELKVAGSFDRLLRHMVSGGTAIGDLKTSEPKPYDISAYNGLKWSIQLAVYAHSTPYCAERGWLSWESLGVPAPSQDRGVVIHVNQGVAESSVYLVDIAAGWQYAKLAAGVLDARRSGPKLATPL